MNIDGAVVRWFAERGWTPFDYQKEVWARIGYADFALRRGSAKSRA